MGRNGEGVGPLAHGIAAVLSSGSFAWRENDFDVQSTVTGEKESDSNRSRERRSAKELGNTLLMALLCVKEGLLAGDRGVWRIWWDEVRNRSSLKQTQSYTAEARDSCMQQWECSLFSFLVSWHTNQHTDTVTDMYRDITHCVWFSAQTNSFPLPLSFHHNHTLFSWAVV